MLELDCALEFFADFAADFFAAMPARPGIFLLEMRGAEGGTGAQPYLARTADIRRAAERLLGTPDAASKQLNLRDVTARIRYRVTGSKLEQNLAFYQNARLYFPSRYRQLMRLRPPAMLKVNLRNAYPRCYVTRQIRGDEGFYFGPFGSRRSAEDFSESFLDLFKTRRCQIKIRRDPTYPGCMYSEMKMCLAPCFAGCTQEEYDVEIGRVLESLESTGSALTERLAQERAAASDELDFERAAALHKRLDKVTAVLRGMPDLARRIEELDLVILQRAAEAQTITVFPVRGGMLEEPVFLRFAEISSEPRSVEAILKEALEPGSHEEGSETQSADAQAESGVRRFKFARGRKESARALRPASARHRICRTISRCWRDGFTPSRGRARFCFATRSGRTAACCALAADCSPGHNRRQARRIHSSRLHV